MRQAKPGIEVTTTSEMEETRRTEGFSPCHECKRKPYSTRERENRAAKRRRDEESVEVRRRRLSSDSAFARERRATEETDGERQRLQTMFEFNIITVTYP